jgi:hypothetical protein
VIASGKSTKKKEEVPSSRELDPTLSEELEEPLCWCSTTKSKLSWESTEFSDSSLTFL